jgi:hypothetical protein
MDASDLIKHCLKALRGGGHPHMNPEAVQPRFLNDDNRERFPRANAFCLISEKRTSSTQMSPAGTLCFDILTPPPGDSDVISQVERLSSNEMKIAPRSLRMALGASGRSAIICMAVSRVGDRNLTLPERRSLSHLPMGS